MAAGMLAGCSSGEKAGVTETTAAETKAAEAAGEKAPADTGSSESPEGTVEFLSQKREDVDLIDGILADFMERHPDISIMQTTTTGSVSFASRVASNDVPDLGHVYASTAYRVMAEEGLFMDLSGQDFLEKVPEEYLEMFTLEDGTVWAVPVNINAFGLYINLDIYEKNGLEIPKTFDELIANCEKLREAGITPFAFAYKDTGALRQCFERTMTGAVNHDFLKVCEEVGLSDKSFADYPDIVEGLEAFVRLLDYADTDPLGMDTNDLANAFTNEEVAMVLNGDWGVSQYLTLNPDLNFKVVILPSITGISSTSVGTCDMCLAISATSDKQEQCLEFIKYFMEPDVIESFAEGDKVPNIVKGVTYRNKELGDIIDAIVDGRFTISPTVNWANGYQSTLQGELQTLVLERDVPAFIEIMDSFSKDIYGQQ